MVKRADQTLPPRQADPLFRVKTYRDRRSGQEDPAQKNRRIRQYLRAPYMDPPADPLADATTGGGGGTITVVDTASVDLTLTGTALSADVRYAGSGGNLGVASTSTRSDHTHSSIIGPTGPTGAASTAVGPQGPQGPQGAQGVQGTPGNAGPTGAQGAQGAGGPQGSAGPQGAVGATGPQGAVGAASTVTGPAGPQGSQGPQGAVGAASTVPGPTGPQGIAGSAGGVGPTGPAGAASTVTGPTGPAGSGMTTASGDARYLKLDASNDPLTGGLIITPPTTDNPLILNNLGPAVAESVNQYSNNTNPPITQGLKSRGASVGSYVAVALNDILYRIQAAGADGSAPVATSWIDWIVDAAVSTGVVPSAFRIITGGNLRVNIASNGLISIFNNILSSGNLTLNKADPTLELQASAGTSPNYRRFITGTGGWNELVYGGQNGDLILQAVDASSVYLGNWLEMARTTGQTKLGNLSGTGSRAVVADALGTLSAARAAMGDLLYEGSWSGVAAFSLPNGTFSTAYRNYEIIVTECTMITGSNDLRFRLRTAGVDYAGAGAYTYAGWGVTYTGTSIGFGSTGSGQSFGSLYVGTTSSVPTNLNGRWLVYDPAFTGVARVGVMGEAWALRAGVDWLWNAVGNHAARAGGATYDALTLYPGVGGNFSGRIAVYGKRGTA